jgi:hypothetical protein
MATGNCNFAEWRSLDQKNVGLTLAQHVRYGFDLSVTTLSESAYDNDLSEPKTCHANQRLYC